MTNDQTIIIHTCPRCGMAYQAIKQRVADPQAGHFDCIDCGSEVHSWFGVYDYVDWRTHRKEPTSLLPRADELIE